MKRIIKLSMLIALGVFLALMSSDSTASAARSRRYLADTGLVTLGPNQVLRVTVAPAAGDDGAIPTETISLNFDRYVYSRGACTGPVCKYLVAAQSTMPVTLAPGETVSIDSGSLNDGRYRLTVICNQVSQSQKVHVNAQIIDTLTGAVVSHGGVQVAAADVGGDN